MRPSSPQLTRLFGPTGIRRNRLFSPHQQQANYLLPFAAGSSCCVEDAKQLFVRCCNYDSQLAAGLGNRQGGVNIDLESLFDESLLSLQRLGLMSLTCDEHVVGEAAKVKRLCREPIFTVMLHSMNVTSSQSSEKGEEALIQVLHGLLIPLMFSGLAASSAASLQSRRSPRIVEDVSAESCFSLLQQSRGGGCSSINETTCRFMKDLVNEALLLGVREKVLFFSGGGLFRLHRDMTQKVSPCLLTFQWWWWQRVDSFLSHAMEPNTAGEKMPLEAQIDAAQERVRYWIKKKDASLPQFLLRGSIDDTMALVADAVRCWRPHVSVRGQTALPQPKWRIQLSEEARTTLALETLQTIRSLLFRRPAGISLSELSKLISWSTLSGLLQKKSLLKTLMAFPSHFVVQTVQDMSVAQLQLDSRASNAINAAEVSAWLLGGRNESVATVASLLQEIDTVIRVMSFLRKRHLQGKRVTFEELRTAVVPSKDVEASEAFLDVLRRYDVVAGLDTEEIISWPSVQQQTVRLSVRESAALEAIETYRKNKRNRNNLYVHAIKPFLLRCDEEMTAAGLSDAHMPIFYLQRWLQVDRLSLNQPDLFKLLRECSLPFVVNESEQTISLGCGKTSYVETKAVPSFKEVPKTLSPPPPPPPPRPPTPPPIASPQKLTFDSQLRRVINGKQPEALLHFAETTIRAVFSLLLPIVSVPSGVRFRTLLRRIRWGSLAVTLGDLPSFLEAFDGLFFDLFVDSSGHVEDMVVAAYRGHVGSWLLYARLISRIFPSDVDIPLRLIGEGLSWGVWFAPRFGDLPTLLRRVGRSIREGYLLAKTETVAADPVFVQNDVELWEFLKNVRKQESDKHQEAHEENREVIKTQQYVLLGPEDFVRYIHCTKETDVSARDDWMQLAESAIQRFPLFFQWYSDTADSTPLLRVTLTSAPAPNGLVSLVEEYVCPLLRQSPDHGISIAELDERMGWSHGNFDTHPAGLAALGVAASRTSLYGILQRYIEVQHPPRLLLLLPPDSTKATLHDAVMVRPNTAIYRSPEDMVLEINGLEYMCTEKGTLRPSSKPISLFELLAEEQEIHGGANTFIQSREEEWCVALQCDGETAAEWEREFTNGSGDILVWREALE